MSPSQGEGRGFKSPPPLMVFLSYICQRSSVAEQSLRKGKVVGSIPTAGSQVIPRCLPTAPLGWVWQASKNQ